jgi:hypothetical protein
MISYSFETAVHSCRSTRLGVCIIILMNITVLIFLLSFRDKARLALLEYHAPKTKKTNQNGNIHQKEKLRVPTSMISS